MRIALEYKSVSKSYSSKGKIIEALNNISLRVNEGEVFGVVGPNGAGKSTCIKIMLDIINDYDGEVTIYEKNARTANARSELAYVPESSALYETLTPLEIVSMGLKMYGRQHNDPNKWANYWLERFAVAHISKLKIRQLSKGTVQRVALAQALAVQPKLLILDEPLSGLDPVGRKEVIDILAEYKDNGGAIFFTSHVLHDVERIADRFGFIHKGELITTRSPRELAAERSDRFIVRYHASSPISSNCTHLRQGEFETEIDQHSLGNFVIELNSQHAHLLTVKPAVSLETLFFKIIQEHDSQ